MSLSLDLASRQAIGSKRKCLQKFFSLRLDFKKNSNHVCKLFALFVIFGSFQTTVHLLGCIQTCTDLPNKCSDTKVQIAPMRYINDCEPCPGLIQWQALWGTFRSVGIGSMPQTYLQIVRSCCKVFEVFRSLYTCLQGFSYLKLSPTIGTHQRIRYRPGLASTSAIIHLRGAQ